MIEDMPQPPFNDWTKATEGQLREYSKTLWLYVGALSHDVRMMLEQDREKMQTQYAEAIDLHLSVWKGKMEERMQACEKRVGIEEMIKGLPAR